LDLAVAAQGANNVSILLGNGDGTFQAPVNYSTGSGPDSVAVGDFNGDGGLDLAVVNGESNTVSILLGDFDGTFEEEKQTLVGNHYFSFGQAADFNGDGALDIALSFVDNYSCLQTVCSGVSILLGNGDGTFQGGVSYATGAGPDSVAIGDFNGDRKPDLGVVNSGCPPLSTCEPTGSVSILLGNGDGTFMAAVSYGVGSIPTSAAVGDFNGDGDLDLAVTNSGSKQRERAARQRRWHLPSGRELCCGVHAIFGCGRRLHGGWRPGSGRRQRGE
jgi:FG-GAP-like repeat